MVGGAEAAFEEAEAEPASKTRASPLLGSATAPDAPPDPDPEAGVAVEDAGVVSSNITVSLLELATAELELDDVVVTVDL